MVIRRRRLCLQCDRRFTTYERIEETTRLSVVKKDGTRVPFEHEKLLGGLQRACWKRPLSVETLQALVNQVEEEVFRKFDREVPSTYLGNSIALRLRKLDKIAYLRFASMYHEFQLPDVIQEAQDILEGEKRDVAGQQGLFNE